MWKPLTLVCRSHTSCNKRDLRLFGADTKHRKKRNSNKKGKSTHFLATTNFGIDLSFPWALHWQVSPALQIWLQAPMLQHKDEGHFIDYQPLFFYSFPQIPDPTQKFCTLCYREMNSLQSGSRGLGKEKLHTGWFFTNFWIMSRYKINLSAAHSLLQHFFPGVTANFTRCTKSTLIKAKELGLTVLFGLC